MAPPKGFGDSNYYVLYGDTLDNDAIVGCVTMDLRQLPRVSIRYAVQTVKAKAAGFHDFSFQRKHITPLVSETSKLNDKWWKLQTTESGSFRYIYICDFVPSDPTTTADFFSQSKTPKGALKVEMGKTCLKYDSPGIVCYKDEKKGWKHPAVIDSGLSHMYLTQTKKNDCPPGYHKTSS